jgi:hypothetical protein
LSIGGSTEADLLAAERDAERGGPAAAGIVRHLWRVIDARDAEIARLKQHVTNADKNEYKMQKLANSEAELRFKAEDRVAQLEAALRASRAFMLGDNSTYWQHTIEENQPLASMISEINAALGESK